MASIRKRKWTRWVKDDKDEKRPVERSAWIADYFDQEGKRRQKTFATKKAADAWLVNARHELSNGIHTPDSASITVAEAGRRWLDHCEREGLERSTIKQRREHLDLHINPFIGGEKLSRLTTPMVREFTNKLRDSGRSRAMVPKVLASLKTLISEAQASGLVAQNVARGVRLTMPSRDKREVAIPTKDELRTMLTEASGRWRPFIVTAIFTGMRVSELRVLSWEHVDLEAKVIRVRQRADAWGQIGPPKSRAGRREIPMAPMVVNTLREWKLECPSSPLNLVFPNGVGNVESYANMFHRGFVPLLKAAKIVDHASKPRFTFHALRHAAASLFIEQGWSPKRVQTVIGHANINMTMDLYGHLFPDPEGDQDAMSQIEARLLG